MGATLIVESAIWYAITAVVVVARIASRKVLLGSFRKFQTDDVLTLLALGADTVLMITINILSTTESNLIDPKNPPILSPEEIERRALGSKLVLVVEQTQIATTWLVKACLLLMYSRLTFSKLQKLCVKLVAGYVALGFVVMEILYFGVWCRPFTQYWAVPPDNIQCSAATNHLITNAILNISSDVFIIIIPLPIFLQINIAPRKKAVLCCVFALGTFTIGAAIANKYYSFSEPWGLDWTYWYIRESSTALIVSNVPFLWTTILFFLRLTPFYGSRTGRTGTAAGPGVGIGIGIGGLGTAYGHNAKSVNHNTVISRGSRGADLAADFHPLDSREDLRYYSDLPIPLRIYKRQEIHITSETPDDSDASRLSRDHISFKI